MGKALVIPNVNFAANALTTVTLEQDVPCTGISLSNSTLNLTSLEPATLTATVTPSNTTDALTWVSSDTSVATVVNGVVTPLKAGSVTITATCGSQVATCAVSIRVFIDAEMTYYYYFGANYSGDVLETLTVSGGPTTTTYGGTIKSVAAFDGQKYARDPDSKLPTGEHAYPAMLPDGCTKLAINLPNQAIKTAISWCDSKTASTTYGSNYLKCRVFEGNPWSGIAGNRTVDIPTDSGSIDSFYISAYLKASDGTLTQDMLDQITVEALYS